MTRSALVTTIRASGRAENLKTFEKGYHRLTQESKAALLSSCEALEHVGKGVRFSARPDAQIFVTGVCRGALVFHREPGPAVGAPTRRQSTYA